MELNYKLQKISVLQKQIYENETKKLRNKTYTESANLTLASVSLYEASE